MERLSESGWAGWKDIQGEVTPPSRRHVWKSRLEAGVTSWSSLNPGNPDSDKKMVHPTNEYL
jgi:hypothetical protein